MAIDPLEAYLSSSSGAATPRPTSSPTPAVPSPGAGQRTIDSSEQNTPRGPLHPSFNRIINTYRQHGWEPTEAEYSQFGTNIDDRYLGEISRQIGRTGGSRRISQTAGQTSGSTSPVTPGPFNRDAFGRSWAEITRGRSGTLGSDWDDVFGQLQRQYSGISRFGSKGDKVRLPNGQWFDAILSAGEGGRGYNAFNPLDDDDGGEFTDPWGSKLESQVQKYLQALGMLGPGQSLQQYMAELTAAKGRQKEYTDRFVGATQNRIDSLKKPVYTDQEEAALRAKTFDQLERRRTATLKNNRDQFYETGFAPTSGLLAGDERSINESFEGGRNSIESDLLHSGIQESQRRQDQVLSLEGLVKQALEGGDVNALSMQAQLAEIEDGQKQQELSRFRESLGAIGIPLELMNQRQQSASQAAGLGGNPQSLIGSIMGLLNYGQGERGLQLRSNQNNMAGLGQLLGILFPGGSGSSGGRY